ncbi:[FeFe] hydrogenase H-cluster radical SAM maturase HydG [Halanaerobium sp. Z-7514]|uniref:[FeFe] hydrogenase H-cluster radical SAM maturase HydG n=1 Tax=Halanaerobium polyolivorans TaxID=2886943 RepID=A0AAW4X023_9FIRM|nr:[FeFe] hydrogenase H-cluster radical SAM maturase HydG [Halanaerobium polyolivorans]MCC3144556.1 [FeFe] hydrogenase H-cluster radical SAM maturase HydG [Halanaerobium polyolivorans]RQD72986.1 MAG: [FeFe] hydrogenase H-cluster radical SAM maturase HydG [Halanaerobium sp. MSAO_Bac5]
MSREINYFQEDFGEDYRTEVCDYITDNKIEMILDSAKKPAKKEIERIIAKALKLNGITPQEAAALLQVEDEEMINKFLAAAKEIKEKIYGKRLVIFAPLYFANQCVNDCLYCGFRKGNKELARKKLSQAEIINEVEALEREGHKRLLVLTGEAPNTDLDYVVESIKTAYSVQTENGGEIRRINAEIAPLSTEDFKKLKEAEIGTYTCFQETYNRKAYAELHPSGPKSNFEWRLSVMDRAQEAGIDDLGIGALFGLYDYKFDAIGLLLHAEYLDQKYGVGPHTISVPRLNPASGSPLTEVPYPLSDADFRKLVAVLRLAVPYTGMILSTRESTKMRNELFAHGVSQISAGSRTTPGGYEKKAKNKEELAQFSLHDLRPIDEIISGIAKDGYIPSFCTACYRLGRTGKDFMDLAKPGKIQEFCRPNAMLTFKEYLEDYGTESSIDHGTQCINNLMDKLEKDNSQLAANIADKLEAIADGEHDLYL